MEPLQFFKCLADDTRLQSLMLIQQVGEACVCDLMQALKLEQPKISRHLALLRKCALVTDERRGKWVYYRINPTMPEWCKAVIAEGTASNKAYFAASLARLKVAQQTTNCY